MCSESLCLGGVDRLRKEAVHSAKLNEVLVLEFRKLQFYTVVFVFILLDSLLTSWIEDKLLGSTRDF